jgi:hypothetical protein
MDSVQEKKLGAYHERDSGAKLNSRSTRCPVDNDLRKGEYVGVLSYAISDL